MEPLNSFAGGYSGRKRFGCSTEAIAMAVMTEAYCTKPRHLSSQLKLRPPIDCFRTEAIGAELKQSSAWGMGFSLSRLI